MQLYRVGYEGDSVLLQKSEEVLFPLSDEDISKINELKEFMLSVNPKAQGISAVQVGWLKRIAIINPHGKPFVIINPAVSGIFGCQMSTESCLSTDSNEDCRDYYKVKRPLRAKIIYYDMNGGFHEIVAYKKEVRVYCHEIDHMDGIMINKIGKFYVSEKK